jgi:hypothetical protein
VGSKHWNLAQDEHAGERGLTASQEFPHGQVCIVPVKTVVQQAALLPHRGRDLLVRQRAPLIDARRTHLTEVVQVPRTSAKAAAPAPASTFRMLGRSGSRRNNFSCARLGSAAETGAIQ